MGIDFSTVRAEHVAEAFKLTSWEDKHRQRSKGIFIIFEGDALPAKQVIRTAYLLANNLPLDTKLKFSSGERIARRLRSLGFVVERRGEITSKEVPVESLESRKSV